MRSGHDKTGWKLSFFLSQKERLTRHFLGDLLINGRKPPFLYSDCYTFLGWV
ncbi:hypothetical protein ApDm4_1902 [Acetobacter pomorum]|nr:hypothetical protein ApDm4_1902 [Acetobacter pomorum]